jgi:DNA-binding NarL/FixJ family response regulator
MLINVAIVEDNKETLDGLSMLLSKAGTMKIAGCYRTGESALEELPVIKPHVALIDLGLPGISGTDVIKGLKSRMPLLQMLVLTAHEDKEHLFEALKSGASGYLLKDSPPAEIIESIEEIHNGGSPMSPKVARYVIDYFNEMELKRRKIEAVLTQREKEILNGISDGLTNKRLADRLFISTHTVRTHIKNIYEKLHVHSKVEAVMRAKREGML